ncbi:MAG: 1-deoxy-D-xylulose-5-phosphate reductoisomerase [Thiotrichales bacterium]
MSSVPRERLLRITILGATGTIGVNTLDVIERNPGRFEVHALTAHHNTELLFTQCLRWQPRFAVVAEPGQGRELEHRLRAAGVATRVLNGAAALVEVSAAPEVDYVMAAIVGAAGLLPTLAAARAGKRVMLANKEALVMSGDLFMQAVRESGAELLPIDSEHNAIFQCMPQDAPGADCSRQGVTEILLTASGGPFRRLPLDQLATVTPEQACAHPNWVMGRKISVDSATMMNKGLEVIEACWLFGVGSDRVRIVIHPQSVIHSLVSYADGSVLAQMGNPDMRTPIAYALGWPQRIDAGVKPLNLFEVGRLDFELPDERRFPCLRLAREALTAGGAAATVLNAANEVAVESFLQSRIPFTAIPQVIAHCLDQARHETADSLESILAADARSREAAGGFIKARFGAGVQK